MSQAVLFVSRHFPVFACLAYGVSAAERVAEAVLSDGPLYELRANNLTQYFVNYPDHGFAKRALIGTVLRPVTHGADAPEQVIFWLMVLVNLLGFAGLVFLLNRLLPHAEDARLSVFLRAGFAIGSVGVVQIAHDYGRFDLMNYFVLGAALWLVLWRKLALAALVCAAGVLIHEAFAIYGVPLVVATAWCAAPPGRRVADAGLVAVVSAAAAAAVLLYGGSQSAAALDIGTGAYVWQRGLIEVGWDMPWGQLAVLSAYWLVLVAVLIWFYRANAKRPDLLFVAALSPFALNLFGIDHGRWVTIGFLVVVITLVLQVRLFGCQWPRLTPGQQRAAGLLVLPLGPHGLTGAWTWLMG